MPSLFLSSSLVSRFTVVLGKPSSSILFLPLMPTAFDSIPQEVLENIAFYAVASEPLGPPRELAPLLLVNRRIHAALSSASNPHLHSRIFSSKFDAAPLVRRLAGTTRSSSSSSSSSSNSKTTARKLAAELRRRCVQLSRLRAKVGCTVGAFEGVRAKDGGGKEVEGGVGVTDEGMRALHEMLWTAYVMMLENEGKNERQLREYARLDRWLRVFWFAEDGASFARVEIRENAWPPRNDLADVSMWLFWFLLKPGALSSTSLRRVHPPTLPTHTKRSTLRWTMQSFET
jgi:hypothetical protein